MFDLYTMKENKEKIAWLTSYDFQPLSLLKQPVWT